MTRAWPLITVCILLLLTAPLPAHERADLAREREAREAQRLLGRQTTEPDGDHMERWGQRVGNDYELVLPRDQVVLPWRCHDDAKDCGDVAERYCASRLTPQAVTFQSYTAGAERPCRWTCANGMNGTCQLELSANIRAEGMSK